MRYLTEMESLLVFLSLFVLLSLSQVLLIDPVTNVFSCILLGANTLVLDSNQVQVIYTFYKKVPRFQRSNPPPSALPLPIVLYPAVLDASPPPPPPPPPDGDANMNLNRKKEIEGSFVFLFLFSFLPIPSLLYFSSVLFVTNISTLCFVNVLSKKQPKI